MIRGYSKKCKQVKRLVEAAISGPQVCILFVIDVTSITSIWDLTILIPDLAQLPQ